VSSLFFPIPVQKSLPSRLQAALRGKDREEECWIWSLRQINHSPVRTSGFARAEYKLPNAKQSALCCELVCVIVQRPAPNSPPFWHITLHNKVSCGAVL
jgi:hypothetical protein